MNENAVRALLEELYVHVAAMPWKDTIFNRSEVVKAAAHDQILNHTLNMILQLKETK